MPQKKRLRERIKHLEADLKEADLTMNEILSKVTVATNRQKLNKKNGTEKSFK